MFPFAAGDLLRWNGAERIEMRAHARTNVRERSRGTRLAEAPRHPSRRVTRLHFSIARIQSPRLCTDRSGTRESQSLLPVSPLASFANSLFASHSLSDPAAAGRIAAAPAAPRRSMHRAIRDPAAATRIMILVTRKSSWPKRNPRARAGSFSLLLLVHFGLFLSLLLPACPAAPPLPSPPLPTPRWLPQRESLPLGGSDWSGVARRQSSRIDRE